MGKDMCEPIAVVGVGCCFPGAVTDVDSYWELLENKTDAITDVPGNRWDIDALYSKDIKTPGKTYATKGGFLPSIDLFDPEFFKIMPREAAHIDPQQRLLLEASYLAMADAGETQETLSGMQTGVYVGVFIHDYQQMQLSDRAQLNAHTGTGTAMSIAANRLSYVFNLTGPSMAVDTACSSSLLAIHLAYQSIRNGECEAALAGGVNVIIKPEMTIAMSKASMLSPDGRCFSFDSRANGYVRGEGAGVVLLKPLSHAIRDNNPIYSIIIGSACNQDGRTIGISVPNGSSQEALLKSAIKNANIEAKDISYVEAHGTGTPVGDPIEANALGRVLSTGRDPNNPCIIGSVKSNIGHLESASGVAGLVKAALILKKGKIPANLNFKQVNPKIDLKKLKIRIPTGLEHWSYPGTKIAGVNSFGFGGTNVHIIMQEYTDKTLSSHKSKSNAGSVSHDDRPHLIKLSAHNPEALKARASQLKLYINKKQTSIEDLAYTLAARTMDFDCREPFVVSGKEELIQKLNEIENSKYEFSDITQADRSLAPLFVFTGMGPQWWGMGRELAARESVFGSAIKRCDEAYKPLLGWSLIEELNRDEDSTRIHETTVSQPAIFSIQVALYKLLESWGIVPSAVVGHSVGEVAAAYAAGILSFEDAISLSYHRSQLQNRAQGTGAMLAVGVSESEIQTRFKKELNNVSIAAINSPTNATLSGDEAVLKSIADKLLAKDEFARFLNVEVPYHSLKMEPLKGDLLSSLAHLRPQIAKIPFYSTVTGQRVKGTELDANYWWRNVREPVYFAKALLKWSEQFEVGNLPPIMEIGPHPVLSNSIQECLEEADKSTLCVNSLRRGGSEHQVMMRELAKLYKVGCKINWRNIYSKGNFIKLPNYPWQKIRCWAESEEAANTRKGIAAQTSITTSSNTHPLLGAKLNLAAPIWNQTISIERFPYLADHKIQGEIVFPGAGFIEMASGAVNVEWGQEECIVENLNLLKAFFVSESESAHVQFCLNEENYFTVSSKQDNVDNWSLHCKGKVRKQAREEVITTIDLEKLKERLVREIPTDYLYELFQQIGFNYGARFQQIVEMYQGRGESLSKIKKPSSEDEVEYNFHPAWLDASLHSLFGALSLGTEDAHMRDQAYLPVSIKRCRLINKPATDIFWSHAKIIKRSKYSFSADVTVYNELAEPVLRIEQLRCEAIDYSSNSIEKRSLEWLYKYSWEKKKAPEIHVTEATTWLIFINEDGKFLEGLLDSHGQNYITVEAGNSYVKVSDRSYQIETSHRDHYDAVFKDIGSRQIRIDNIVYGFAFSKVDEKINHVDEIMEQQEFGFGSIVKMLQAMNELEEKPKSLRLLTCETLEHKNQGCNRVIQSPLVGLVRVLGNEHPEIHSKMVDIAVTSLKEDESLLFSELMPQTDEEEVALRSGDRFVRRLNRWTPHTENESKTAKDQAFRMGFREPGHLDTLIYQPTLLPTPKAHEVLIKVSHAALNFKDVLKAGGLFPIDLMEENLWSGDGLGMECSGIILSVGDKVQGFSVGQRVMALAPHSLRSHTLADAALVVPIDTLSDEAAAAMPMVYLTAYYGLIELANLKAGERVLIHAAAGGVGQAAIQLAQWVGAEIYVTVSSNDKGEFLRESGVKNIYNSRSTHFSQDILSDTNGEGVDVVLNSLAGPMIDLSLTLLHDYGRFVEIGKMDINRDKMIGMKPFHYNLSFFALDLDRMLKQKTHYCGEMLKTLHSLYLQGAIKPLKTTSFAASNAQDAFRWMLSGEHAGKIVVSFTDHSSIPISAANTPLFDESEGILITGGLGGFGSSLAHWLVDRGCRRLYLCGRRGATTPAAKNLIKSLERKSAKIIVVKADVSDQNDIGKIEAAIQPDQSIRGIFHAAGVLDDALLLQQDMNKFTRVAETKIKGSWNLHKLSENWDLSYFVMFSSIATTLGNQGSGNYAAANAFMDGLAHYRRQKNLAALTVNWGVIANVGMAADEDFYRRSLEENGLRALHSRDGLDLMGVALCGGENHITISPIDWKKWLRFNPSGANTRFSALAQAQAQGQVAIQSIEEQSLRQKLASTPEDDVTIVAEMEVRRIIAQLFGFDEERLDLRKPLINLGMDSLMAVELKAKLDRLGIAIPVAALLRDMSVVKIVEEMLATFKFTYVSDGSHEDVEVGKGDCIVISQPRPDAKFRMFCFPYAGAGPVVFQNWPEKLSAEIEVCAINLPGRSRRLDETPLKRIHEMKIELAEAISGYLDKPFILFGHCMGAILMYELAAHLKKMRGLEAHHIFVSGCMAPHLYNAPMVYSVGEKKFLDVLDLISFTSANALHKDQEVLDLMTPMLRADFEAVAHYGESRTNIIQFSSPITGFAARQDLFAAPIAMQAWGRYSKERFELNMLDGDHYFIESRSDLLLGAINMKLGFCAPGQEDLSDLDECQNSANANIGGEAKNRITTRMRIALNEINPYIFNWINGYDSEKFTLFCFPGAWEMSPRPKYFPEFIHKDTQIAIIQYAGHGLRREEHSPANIYQILNELYPAIVNYTGRQFAFIGHCFGSIIQYELAVLLMKYENIQPNYMIASGAVSPKIYTAPNGHLLSDSKIIELLDVIDCPLVEALKDQTRYDEIMRFVRSDLKLMAGYRCESNLVLDCPITTFAGQNDLWTYPLEMSSWNELSSYPESRPIMHKGTHFINKEYARLFSQSIKEIQFSDTELDIA